MPVTYFELVALTAQVVGAVIPDPFLKLVIALVGIIAGGALALKRFSKSFQ
jgi:hypothetical protein